MRSTVLKQNQSVTSSDRMVERAQAADGFRAFENQAGDKFQKPSMPMKVELQ